MSWDIAIFYKSSEIWNGALFDMYLFPTQYVKEYSFKFFFEHTSIASINKLHWCSNASWFFKGNCAYRIVGQPTGIWILKLPYTWSAYSVSSMVVVQHLANASKSWCFFLKPCNFYVF